MNTLQDVPEGDRRRYEVRLVDNAWGEPAGAVVVLPVAGERLLNAREAARYVGCHWNTVYDAAKAGRLRFRAIGRLRRFTVEDLNEWTRRSA